MWAPPAGISEPTYTSDGIIVMGGSEVSKKIQTLLTALLLSAFLCLLPGNSFAADSKSLTKNVKTQEECQRVWNELWSKAKKGDNEALFSLFIAIAPPPDMQRIIVPGSSGDLVSTLKDITIVSVHSYEYMSNLPEENAYRSMAKHLYEQTFSQSARGKKFLQCVNNKSQDCAKLAVQENLVPSFEEYAKKIDFYVSAGFKSSCSN